jgi:NADPH-dependent 2,4-dienoyl-CoA reductase/sulfur reductase-like enzyme
MEELSMKFVVIGADAAGMSAASRAKRNDPGMEVIVLEKTTDVSYSACGMPYNIADATRDMDDLVVRAAAVFREKQGIDLRTGHCVEGIDASQRKVFGRALGAKRFELDYDRLLIATGASPIWPQIPGVKHPGVLALKSLADGRRIKQVIAEHEVKTAVILGMGYIAMEMAEALRSRGIAVSMVKPRPRLAPWMPETMAAELRLELEKNMVTLYPGQQIEAIEKAGGRLRVLCTEVSLDADLVIVAIGVTPNSDLAAGAGLKLSVDASIAVDRRLKTVDEAVFAAGDCADAFHVVTGQRCWIPLALRANRAGWAVADNVCGKSVEVDGVAATAVFKAFDLQVARTGLTVQQALEAGFDPVQELIQTRSRAHSHPGALSIWVQMVGDRKSGRLLGVQMIGREGVAHRINAGAVALHARMTVERFAQTDLAYAPPFGPVWDPLLTAANQLLKKM